jgi:hypothetical protein
MSLTLLSLAALAIVTAAGKVGVAISEQEFNAWWTTTLKLATVAGQLLALAGAWYGRWRKGDITWWGKRLDR